MKKVDLNFAINDLKGSEIGRANELVASALMYKTERVDPVKFFDWAIKLQNGGVITLDNSDFNKFKNTIQETETLFVVAKGPIIKYLDEIKESK